MEGPGEGGVSTSSDASIVVWSDTAAEQVIDAHRDLAGPILPTLQALQAHFGYVDPRAVPLVAEALNVSRAEVHGVLTFYHDLHTSPPADVTVHICTAEACQARGSRQLVADVEQRLGARLGERSADGRVDLQQVFCLGNCALGPSAIVDGKVHGRLDADRVQALVDHSLEGGRP
jgi:formate dehydrogenase subunit gamma